jgi:hypothetical protein
MSKEERSLRDIADAWRTDKKRTAVSRTYDVMVEGVGVVQVCYICIFYYLYVDSLIYVFGWSVFLCRIRFFFAPSL